MGRPRKKTEEIFEEGQPQTEAEMLLADFVSTIPDFSEVRVYRMPVRPSGVSQKGFRVVEEYLDVLSPPVSEETIKENYGPGSYRLRFIMNDGTQNRTVATKVVHIGTVGNQPAFGGDKKETANGDRHYDFLREQMAQQQNLILALIGSNKGPDIGSMMTGLGTILAAVMSGKGDVAAQIQAMASVWAQLKPPVSDDLDKLVKLTDIAKNLSGGGGSDDDISITGLAKAVVPGIVKSLMPAGGTVPQQQPQTVQITSTPVYPPEPRAAGPALSPSVQPGPAATTIPTPEDQEQMMLRYLTAQLTVLKNKARLNKDVNFWIDYMFDNEEDPGVAAVFEALDRGATMENLIAFDPEIGQNPQLKDWFQRFYDGLRRDMAAAGMDTTGSAGHAGDPSKNEGTGDPGQQNAAGAELRGGSKPS